MIRLTRDILNDLDAATAREWLETNGIGGYALGTVSGTLSRRYHGSLVAAARPPLGRVVLLSKFEETLVIGERRFELSTNHYAGAVDPHGYQLLTSFRIDPFPTWTYEVGGVVLEKSLFMVQGENAVVYQWRILSSRDAEESSQLEVRPLVAFRDHHHLQHEDPAFDPHCEIDSGLVMVRPFATMPPLYLSHNAEGVDITGYWYRNFDLAIEQERGFDHLEDLYQPFSLKFSLGSPASVVASTEPHSGDDADGLRHAEIKRRESLVGVASVEGPICTALVAAADQFIVRRGVGKTVIAGYPWFSDWGRDTMIALPGVTLATGRPEIAKSIILEFSNHISEGMLPNRFPDEGETPEYNTVDATLWYFEAIRAYVEYTGDLDLVRGTLFDKLKDIIEWHVIGTRYGIGVDTDGLLRAGEPGVQLTWMDAKVGDHVVTPRTGKPVEIQALWYNALRIMAELAHDLGHDDSAEDYARMADSARVNFASQFWYEEGGYLYDVIDGEVRDRSLRPNQLLAISLAHQLIDGERARQVVAIVERQLLTPVGLRSLSPDDERYVGVYQGPPEQRDASYHQGTVWAWLIGPFIDAYRKVHAGEEELEGRVSQMLSGFADHLSAAGLGQVSEIFDGDPPHTPRGCPAQAWSVAEVLRVMKAIR